MRSIAVILLGTLPALAAAEACAGPDRVRHTRDEDGGAGGASGASDPGGAGGADHGGGQGDAGPGGTPNAGGAGGRAEPSAGADSTAAGAAPLGSAGAGGDFTPEAARIALGGSHACVLSLDQTVSCWGRADHGETGDGIFHPTETPSVNSPFSVPGLSNVTQLALGDSHSCALSGSPAVLSCWGGGWLGQLGDGVKHVADTGVASPLALDLPGVIQVAAAGNGTCVLLSDRSVRCWGQNLFGQLGDGSTNDSAKPVAVKDLSGVTAIAVGSFAACALLDDGTVECWGEAGESGGSTLRNLSPTPIEGLTGVTAISLGNGFGCAIVAGGDVRCWGAGPNGERGDGTTTPPNTNNVPVAVTGLHDIVQISSTYHHSCALRRDRALFCWGTGQYGELGDGVFHNGFPTYVTSPTRATVFDDVTEVRVSDHNTCVRTSTGSVLCVGSGSYGQLGDGQVYPQSPFGKATAVESIKL